MNRMMIEVAVDATAGSDANQRLSMVVAALFVLAGVIAVVTVIYWWSTRPGRGTRDGGTIQ